MLGHAIIRYDELKIEIIFDLILQQNVGVVFRLVREFRVDGAKMWSSDIKMVLNVNTIFKLENLCAIRWQLHRIASSLNKCDRITNVTYKSRYYNCVVFLRFFHK